MLNSDGEIETQDVSEINTKSTQVCFVTFWFHDTVVKMLNF